MSSQKTTVLPPTTKGLWTYRIIGIVISMIIVGLPYLIPPETNVDPLWQRFTLGGFIFAYYVAHTFSPFLQKHTYYGVYLYTFLINLWLIQLAYLNNFSVDYSPTVFIALLGSGVTFKHLRILLFYLGALFVFSLCLYAVPPAPLFSPFFFSMLLLFTMIGLGLLMDRQIRERKLLKGREGKQRVIAAAALEHSEDGILVSDHNGVILDFNDRFMEIWGLSEEDLQGSEPRAGVDKALELLVDPEDFNRSFRESLVQPEKHIYQSLEFKDGRSIDRISKPLQFGGEFAGRIWFFKDVTQARRERRLMHEQSKLLQTENMVLSQLAAENEGEEASIGSLLMKIAPQSLEILGAKCLAVWIRQENGEDLECIMRHGDTFDTSEASGLISPKDHPMLWGKLSQVRVFPVENPQLVPELKSFSSSMSTLLEVASMIIPVKLSGELNGFIMVMTGLPKKKWSANEINFGRSLGEVLGTVTESVLRVKAEQRLQEKLAVLQSVFEISDLGIVVTSLQGQVMDFNQDFISMWNFESSRFPGITPDEISEHVVGMLEDPRQGLEILEAISNDPLCSIQRLVILKDGRQLEGSMSIMYMDGQPTGRIWFYRDVTQRKKDEAALIASEVQNRAIVHAVPDVMIRMNLEGKVLYQSIPDSDTYWYFQQKENTELCKLFPEDFTAEILETAAKVDAGQKDSNLEQQLEFDGQQRDLEIRIVGCGPREVLAIVRDVTARKTAERELLQRNFELDSFVYRSSHDLKAPLNSLMGLIDILNSQELPPEMTTYLQLMDRSVVKLDTFIRNLSDFSRIARLEVQHQRIDFVELLTETQESLKYMDHSDRIEQRVEITGETPFVGDNFHTNIVLSNLISNAIKYQDHKKEVSFVEVSVSLDLEHATIVVTDNGIGIPKEHQSRLFELFFRASTQSFGSGLGLYITQNAIEKIGGNISMESEEGKGTSFKLVVPNHLELEEA